MMKRVASFTLNRLFVLALVWFAVNAYARTSCQSGGVFSGPLDRVLSGLKQITDALE